MSVVMSMTSRYARAGAQAWRLTAEARGAYQAGALLLRGSPSAAGWFAGWLATEFPPHVVTGHALSRVPRPSIGRIGHTWAAQRADEALTAALVDGPVVEGKIYPPSHTRLPDGRPSPGLNRYEACLEFSHGGTTRYYCGDVGVLSSRHDILKVFWGLVWVEFLPDESYRVEKIVQRYRGGDPPPRREAEGHPFRSFLRRFARRFA